MNFQFLIRTVGCVLAVLFVLSGTACSGPSSGLKDGYYTAETENYDAYGWKEFLVIYVSDERIVTAEYDAKNAGGLIKSWDMDYMREMEASDDTYPNEYTRIYTEALLNRQTPDGIDAVSGATHSYNTFQRLAKAAIDHAKAGDKSIAYVPLSE